jgi:hypothetical protein
MATVPAIHRAGQTDRKLMKKPVCYESNAVALKKFLHLRSPDGSHLIQSQAGAH